jgi:hypothetical protein
MTWHDTSGRPYAVGATDPAESPKGSLRAEILARWQELGLKSKPYTGENGVHASASPLEGLAERANWLKAGLNTAAPLNPKP